MKNGSDWQSWVVGALVLWAFCYVLLRPYRPSFQKVLIALALQLIRIGHTKAGFWIYSKLQKARLKK